VTLAGAFGAGFAAALAGAGFAFGTGFAFGAGFAFDAGFTGAFATALAAGRAETVFLALVGLADGFLTGIYGLRGHCEGRGIIQTARRGSTHQDGIGSSLERGAARRQRCCGAGHFLLHFASILETP